MTLDLGGLDHVYRAYGLSVHSEVPLPELAPAVPGEACEGRVAIRLGRVPRHLRGGRRIAGLLEHRGALCHYDFPEAGRYLVARGEEITVEPAAGAAEGNMRAYLFGSAMGTLLHQRRLLPLHVSAVATPRGLVAFTGASGAGKSTMAGLLHRETGWPLFSDDVAVLRPDEGPPLLRAGVLRLKLWRDAVALLGADPARLTRDVARHEKFHLDAPEMFGRASAPLAALFELEAGDAVEIRPVAGFQSFEMVARAIYRPYLVGLFGDMAAATRRCAEVAAAISCHTLRRPWSPAGLAGSVRTIAERFSADA